MTVALYEPLTTPEHGSHHQAFTVLFSKYLIGLGHDILLVTAGAGQQVEKKLIEDGISTQSFFVHDIQYGKISSDLNWKGRDAWIALGYWRQSSKHIQSGARKHQLKIDHVFLAWLDTHVANYLPHQVVDRVFNYNWSGLYFHPWFLYQTNSLKNTLSSKDYVLKSRNCMGVAVHDEFLVEQLSKRINKPVILFPEIADSSPPSPSYELSSDIKRRSEKRTIVSLIGIRRRKGILHFIDLCQRADPSTYYFFFCGPLEESEFNSAELASIRSVLDNPAENIFYYPSYLPEGREVNSVIAASDILFIVYENFKSSSNFSTKAALFKKPVLATDRFWIGQVTKKYRMGITVKEGDHEDTLEKLNQLEENIRQGLFRPDWEGYLKVHQEGALKEAFAKLLAKT